MRRLLLVVLILLSTANPIIAQGGKLQQVREAVDRRASDSSSSKDKNEENSTSDDADSDCLGEIFGPLYTATLLAPFALPHRALHDAFDIPGYFPRHPYAYGQDGYLQFDKLKEGEPGHLRTWAGRVSVDNGNDFDDLNRTGASLFLETSLRIGLQARYDFLTERLPCSCIDYSHLGSTELTYRFAQSQHVQMYAGAGLRVFDDRVKTHYGFNVTYGADLFPVKPFVVSLSVDGGTVGDAGLFRARGTAGVLYRGFEVFTGYDYLNIGGVDIQGLLFGMRLWF